MMIFSLSRNFFAASLMVPTLLAGTTLFGQEWKSGVEWQKPPVVAPGQTNSAAPSDAIVLFDGTNLEQWEGGDQWTIQDGIAIPREGNISTKQSFGDIQLHLEWAAPEEIEGEGQGRGNSGVYLMGQYEVQILDSYHNPTYFDGQAAAIYKQTPPMANAMRPPGEWNTYDIIFTAPKFRANGSLREPAYVTVIHNGIVVQSHFEILGTTGYTQAPTYEAHAEKAPLKLQFHRDPVQFRNIWVRELEPAAGERVSAPYNVQRRPQPEQKDSADDAEDSGASDQPEATEEEEAPEQEEVAEEGEAAEETEEPEEEEAETPADGEPSEDKDDDSANEDEGSSSAEAL